MSRTACYQARTAQSLWNQSPAGGSRQIRCNRGRTAHVDQGVAALAEYLFKVQDGYGIAAELVRADLKRARRKVARVPFQIAEGAAACNVSDRHGRDGIERAFAALRRRDRYESSRSPR